MYALCPREHLMLLRKAINCLKECIHNDPDRLESLRDERMKGNHKKTTDKYIEILLQTIDKGPKKLGYDFGRWTSQRLRAYLEKTTGIQLTGAQVRRILEQKK
jgi:transposase